MKKQESIGSNVKRLRKERQLTQEALGKKLGVTTQAVSKWECGGTPDAALLPALADALGVSIDALFGRSDEAKQDLRTLIGREVQRAEQPERFETAYKYAWTAILAASEENTLNDLVIGDAGPGFRFRAENDKDFLMRLFDKTGYGIGSMTADHRYLFAACRPDGGFGDTLGEKEPYRACFSLLSDPDILTVLFFLMKRRPGASVTAGVTAKKTGLSEKKAASALKRLSDAHVLEESEVETEDGTILSYTDPKQLWTLSLLLLARNLFAPEHYNLDFSPVTGRAAPPLLE